MRCAIGLAVGLIAVASCTAHFKSSIRIDGITFAPDRCRSGQALGFDGVTLYDQNGKRLDLLLGHLNSNPNYSRIAVPTAVLFTSDTPGGVALSCRYEMKMDYEASKIIYRNVRGVAELACLSPQHEVTGLLEFEHCH